MASTIQLKTGTGSAVPSSLTQGEVAINVDNGLIYYGSGSVNSVKQLESFTHITASGNISASGNIIANEVHALNMQINSQRLTISDDNLTLPDTGLNVSSNITASGNISASGNVIASTFVGNIDAVDGDFDGTLEADTITIGGTNINSVYSPIEGSDNIVSVGTIGEGVWNGTTIASANLDADTAHLTTDQTFTGNKTFSATITASSNISASGNIIASNVFLPGTGIISFDNSLDGTDQFIKGQDNNIVIDGDDLIKLKADDHVQFVDNSNDVFVAINPNIGNITASGTISASGTIYGRQWEQIETNLSANIGSLSSGHDGDDFIFLPWTDTDTENASSGNKFVNRTAVAPGKPVKTAVRSATNALGTTAYTMSLWENKTDQGNNNLVLVTEACADSTGTNRETLTFDWTNPCSGSNVDIAYGSKMWMGLKTTNGSSLYVITHLWEWDYGAL